MGLKGYKCLLIALFIIIYLGSRFWGRCPSVVCRRKGGGVSSWVHLRGTTPTEPTSCNVPSTRGMSCTCLSTDALVQCHVTHNSRAYREVLLCSAMWTCLVSPQFVRYSRFRLWNAGNLPATSKRLLKEAPIWCGVADDLRAEHPHGLKHPQVQLPSPPCSVGCDYLQHSCPEGTQRNTHCNSSLDHQFLLQATLSRAT
jgi:hypothetical protein